jgi:hypothetical protein
MMGKVDNIFLILKILSRSKLFCVKLFYPDKDMASILKQRAINPFLFFEPEEKECDLKEEEKEGEPFSCSFRKRLNRYLQNPSKEALQAKTTIRDKGREAGWVCPAVETGRNPWYEYTNDAEFSNRFTRMTRWRDLMYLFPNVDHLYMTPYNNVARLRGSLGVTAWSKKYPQERLLSKERIKNITAYSISLEPKRFYVAMTLFDVMMWDFDDKEIKMSPEGITKVLGDFNEMEMVFFAFRSDRGFHVFEVSREWDHQSLATTDLMMSVCNDHWYTAYINESGWNVRLNAKKDFPDDRVAVPIIVRGKVSTDEKLLPLIDFPSAFYDRKVPLHYFGPEELPLITVGNPSRVNPRQAHLVLLHYLLAQLCRRIHGVTYFTLVEAMYMYLEFNKPDPKISAIRKDIAALDKFAKQTFGLRK